MRHLSPETLARIADGPATEEEAGHLDACPECRAELDAMREQLAAVETLPPPPLPDEVRKRVEAAVLAARADAAGSAPGGPYRRWGLRAAAALALFLGGAAVGAGWSDRPPRIAERDPTAIEPATTGPATTGPVDEGPAGTLVSADPASDEPTDGPKSRARAAAGSASRGSGAPVEVVRTPADRGGTAERPVRVDPEAALREAEARYVEALVRYAEEEGAPIEGDPTNRLAALEGILYTTRAALDESPDDPVLEGFYRSALAQREAMLNEVTITTAQAVY